MDLRVKSEDTVSTEHGSADSGRPAAQPPAGSRPLGLFYGWWMVGIAGAVQFLAGGFYQLGFSVYFLPISRDLGLSRTALSLVFSLRSFEGGIDGPIVGYLVDRLGPRFMFRVGAVLIGLGFVLLAFTQDYLSFLLVFLGLVAFGVHAGTALPAASLVNHWFAKKRAMATTLSHIGVEVGGFLLTPLVAFMVLNLGWRQGAIVTGIVFITLVPILSLFVRNEPEEMGLRPDNAPPRPDDPADGASRTPGQRHVLHEGDFTVREALHTWTYWQLSAAIGMRQFSKQVLTVHLIPLLVWKGFDEPAGALLLGLFALFQLPLRVVSAWVADRWSMTKVSGLSALAGVGAIAALLAPGADWVANGLLFVFLFALGETGNSPGWAVIGQYFGRSNYATIRGTISFVQSAISLPAPVFAGWIYDTTQSYYLALLPIAGSYIMAFFLYWTLRPPRAKVPERVDGIVPAL